MHTLSTAPEMHAWSEAARRQGSTIGFVPTMGALHQGHLSLVERARERCEAVVASVFVNPTQFAPGEDFEKYPRTVEEDRAKLEALGVNVLFAPTTADMYPDGFETKVLVEGPLTSRLEGERRPTHFAGVTQIVSRLFLAVKPHVAVFGRKDAQQALVIRKMTRDLMFGIEIDVAPTMREPDGLAMSSRNRYLSEEERRAALAFPRALRTGLEAWRGGQRRSAEIVSLIEREIAAEPRLDIEYVAAVSQRDLSPVGEVSAGSLVAAAVRAGMTRLVDNWWVTDEGAGEF